MKSIQEAPITKGMRVIVRADYNVPTKGTKILDPRRIEASYKTIDFLLKKGASIVLISHSKEATLAPVFKFLQKKYAAITFAKNIESIPKEMKSKDIVLLENIRQYPDEETNDAVFTKHLASLGEIYVNDAFSVSHRKHASVVGVPKKLPAYTGFSFAHEVKNLTLLDTDIKHPFVLLLGGAKFSTKIPLIKKFIEKTDYVIVTGAILNNFYKAAGFEVGKSVVEDGYDKEIVKLLKNEKILLPVDVVVLRADKKVTTTPDTLEKGDIICDIGAESTKLIANLLIQSKLIVWNGPTGWYEKGFTKATKAIAEAVASGKARAIVGGGDTGLLVEKTLEKTKNKKVFVSTAGGATLDYLANGTLPGIKTLDQK
jgi:phosphoglycerate kinase